MNTQFNKNKKKTHITFTDNKKQFIEKEVIIIGAGPAGIGAARQFLQHGIKSLVLEAQATPGGRVKSHKFAESWVDLGAQWIHFWSNKNPMKQLVEELEYPLNYRNGGRNWDEYDQNVGGKYNPQIKQQAKRYASYLINYGCEKAQKEQQDISVQQGFQDQYQKLLEKHKNDPVLIRMMNLSLYRKEHYEAACLNELSGKNGFAGGDLGGGDITTLNGYGNLLKQASEPLNIQFNEIVKEINYENPQKIIITTDKQQYECMKIIITVPLGVLKSGDIKFTPQLPPQKLQAIKNLGMGVMNKIFLEFQDNFWGDCQSVSIAHDQRGKNPFFYNLTPYIGKNVLELFVTDSYAKEIETKADEEIINSVLDSLKCAFGNQVKDLKSYYITRWGQNKFSYGSYSHFAVNSSMDTCYDLVAPINDRVYFAGEHCYPACLGIASGAYNTGIDAATSILQWVAKQK